MASRWSSVIDEVMGTRPTAAALHSSNTEVKLYEVGVCQCMEPDLFPDCVTVLGFTLSSGDAKEALYLFQIWGSINIYPLLDLSYIQDSP